MIREILKYGAPELAKKSAPVTDFDSDLRVLAEDMLETMYAAPGVGLAAPQVGVNLRMTVIDIAGHRNEEDPLILVNPRIVGEEGSQKGEEGCLSIPDFTAVVERPYRVNVTAQDLEGHFLELDSTELLARVLCHEIDHLEGILYLDRISPLRRDLIKRKIRKLRRAGDW
ncbi:MAG: peptide deformylase [Acidobacteriota bacterium]